MTAISLAMLTTMSQMPVLRLSSLLIVTPQSQEVRPRKEGQSLPFSRPLKASAKAGVKLIDKDKTIMSGSRSFLNNFIINPFR